MRCRYRTRSVAVHVERMSCHYWFARLGGARVRVFSRGSCSEEAEAARFHSLFSRKYWLLLGKSSEWSGEPFRFLNRRLLRLMGLLRVRGGFYPNDMCYTRPFALQILFLSGSRTGIAYRVRNTPSFLVVLPFLASFSRRRHELCTVYCARLGACEFTLQLCIIMRICKRPTNFAVFLALNVTSYR